MSGTILSRIPWYHSLRIRLLIFLVAALCATVAAVSIQDSRMFRSVLEQQYKQDLTEAARKSSATVESTIEVWLSLMTAFMHNIGRTSTSSLKSQLNAILESNREIVAIHIIRKSEDKNPETILYGFTPFLQAPQFAEQNAISVSQQVQNFEQQPSQQPSQETEKEQEQEKEKKKSNERWKLKNLQNSVGLSILQLSLPFATAQKKDQYHVLFYVWPDRIRAAMHTDSNTTGFLIDKKQQIILASHDVKRETSLHFSKRYSELLLKKDITFGVIAQSENSENASGEKGERLQTDDINNKTNKEFMSSFSRLENSSLMLILERQSSSLTQQLNWRIQRIMLFAWIVVLLGVLLVYFSTGYVIRNILETIQTTLAIATGDLKARVRVETQDEISILGNAVNHMAAGIEQLMGYRETAIRQEHELKTAQAVQRTLLPKPDGDTSLLDIRGYYRSASQCAGDWWGSFSLGGNRTLVIIADATGHGAHAALLVAIAFGYFEFYCRTVREGTGKEETLIEILKRLNAVLFASGSGKNTMTMMVMLVDSNTQEAHFCNAGHLPPYVFRDSTETEPNTKTKAVSVPGSILGFEEHPQFSTKVIPMDAQTRIVLYTDGLIECNTTENVELGPRFRRVAEKIVKERNGLPLFDGLFQFIETSFNNVELSDDITCVVCEYRRNSEVSK